MCLSELGSPANAMTSDSQTRDDNTILKERLIAEALGIANPPLKELTSLYIVRTNVSK